MFRGGSEETERQEGLLNQYNGFGCSGHGGSSGGNANGTREGAGGEGEEGAGDASGEEREFDILCRGGSALYAGPVDESLCGAIGKRDVRDDVQSGVGQPFDRHSEAP